MGGGSFAADPRGALAQSCHSVQVLDAETRVPSDTARPAQSCPGQTLTGRGRVGGRVGATGTAGPATQQGRLS